VVEEEDEQEVGCATEEGVRRRRWEKWDLGLTRVTKCGLFYSWKVVEAEKRIDRSTRTRRKLLHINTYRYSRSPDCLPIYLSTCQRAFARIGCLPACAAIRTPFLFDHLSPSIRSVKINIANQYARHVRVSICLAANLRRQFFFLVIASFISH